ncbi:MAG: hydrogenase maturation nickel metallochaperone HypA [Bifidobacteriaceae bacterium]|jgi:hydrogenase nickel incorporation protein HypA/HybF|nr:hydrogenase maturation nickel metallochaperone HypA [Bifidobacteriaceae bacterium]
MHELSLCRSIYTIVRRAVPARRVVAILLDVGALRQVVPPTLECCWGIVTEGTALEGSDLRVRTIPGVLECAECGTRTEMGRQLRLACGTCESARVRVVTGEEFMVRSVDVSD